MNSGYSELLQFGMKSRGNKHQPIISRIIDFHGFIHEFSAVGDKQVGLKRMIYDNDVFIEFYDSDGKCLAQIRFDSEIEEYARYDPEGIFTDFKVTDFLLL